MCWQSALACCRCQAERPFHGDPRGGCATPCNLHAYEKNYQIDEAMNGVAHFANGRREADGEEPYEDGEHASGRNASSELPQCDGYLGESDGEIGEDDCNDLEGAAAQTS